MTEEQQIRMFAYQTIDYLWQGRTLDWTLRRQGLFGHSSFLVMTYIMEDEKLKNDFQLAKRFGQIIRDSKTKTRKKKT